ncbi:MAG: nicotinate (nicotinamide) nucleotide adenylyltransferase [Lentisphaerae bacterium GWF2_52_8]|nr:MAG: nicotinate (nicotinamide) nucleotide adenylyltransferase [Lentisphaerae bacterium GWF2_52_8]
MRTAVFGGTFDPPHFGHRKLALAVLESKRADKILFVPAWHPPHKPGLVVASFEERMEMLRLAIEGEHRFEISDIEARRTLSPSYTSDTMEALEAERPGEELLLLMGSDSLRQLHTWHRAGELVARWPLLVYPRADEETSMGELSSKWPPETARQLFSAVLSGAPVFPYASTRLRDLLAAGKDPGDIIAPAVYLYIKARKLYLKGQSLPGQ